MKKAKIIFTLLLIIVFTVSGCGVKRSDKINLNVPDINPKAEAANKDTSNVTLYFSYDGENLLAGETRAIDVPVSETLEVAVVNALISGPSAGRDELRGLFWEGVELKNLSTRDDIIFITFNESFLSNIPEDEITLDEKTAGDQKKLAIYSIVNTLTEMGKYSRVQIEVARDGGSSGRITRSEAGFKGNEYSYLEPLAREGSLILTPEITLKQALDSFAKKDWNRLYTFTAHAEPDGTIKPDMNDFSEALAAKGYLLMEFEVLDSNVSYDGQSVVVMLDYSLKTKEGDIIPRYTIPVMLIREDDIWKLSYSSLVNILINV